MAKPLSYQLIDLYRIAIDEYRFEVRLGWDRAMYYMVFNTAIISVGMGVLKLGNSPLADRFVASIFLVGFCTSVIGQRAIRKAHEYYRRTVVKKTLIEDMLGLTAPVVEYSCRHTLAIESTTGQGQHVRILHDPDAWVGRRLRKGSVVFLLASLLWLLAFINLIGIAFAMWLSFIPVRHVRPSPPSLIPVKYVICRVAIR